MKFENKNFQKIQNRSRYICVYVSALNTHYYCYYYVSFPETREREGGREKQSKQAENKLFFPYFRGCLTIPQYCKYNNKRIIWTENEMKNLVFFKFFHYLQQQQQRKKNGGHSF